MKRLELFYRFLESNMLINRRIIKYAMLSIKLEVIDGQSVEYINNPNLITDHSLEEKEVVFGAYEVDHCLDFAKYIRKELWHSFLKQGGKFTFKLEPQETFPFLERLFRIVLKECGFDFTRNVTEEEIIYTAY